MGDRVTIMDGGMGRFLLEIGAPFRRPEWSALALMEDPQYVTKAHEAFIESGAEIIITNSYALVPFHIGQKEFDVNGRSLIRLAGKIARDAAKNKDRAIKVAGSLPPAFGSYRPDLFIEDKASEIYTPLIEEQDPYVDFWIAETVSHTNEAKVISDLLKDNNKPLWLAYTVRDREETDTPPQLRSGETIEDAVNTAIDLKTEAILFNCSQPEEMTPVLEIVQQMNIPIPYGVYANAFEPIKRDQQANLQATIIRQDTTPAYYLELAEKWKTLGASIIGGCCGIGPAHIQELTKLNKD